MRPPHESATSSGCGATKTWVMAGPSIPSRAAGSSLSSGRSGIGPRPVGPGRQSAMSRATLVFRRWIATIAAATTAAPGTGTAMIAAAIGVRAGIASVE